MATAQRSFSRSARVALSLLLCGLGTRAQATCAEPAATQQLGQVISAGNAAFGSLDADGFRQADSEASRLLPCLDEALDPVQVSALHKMHALAAFLDRDHAAAVAAFRSMLASAPGYRLSEDLAPPNHPLRVDFEVAAGTASVAGTPLEAPKRGWVHVDGKAQDEVPVDRPWVFQRFDEDGQVLSTALVPVGADLPPYPSRARGGSSARVPLWITTGVAAAASGTFFLLAQSNEQAFWDPSTPDAELPGLRSQTNTFGWLSAGAGVLAVGTGTGAVLSGSF